MTRQTKEHKPKKHPGGRPKIQLKDLPKNWKQIILDGARIGKGEVELRCDLANNCEACFSNDLWYRLKKEEQEFSDTIKTAETLCEAWWRNIGREAITKDKPFNHGLWYMNMKNRFGWHDRQEQVHSGVIKTHIDLNDFRESYEHYKKPRKNKG